ncbi:DUF6516 family protein [Pantoea sp. BAV 3049]|uniref:toxin-antitoxin system TumE family protein n=1 Tax=Pantoea sp. BAV 3049 TaxID=2654188 RepID=UPI00131AD983|nr:DUF6516 family protein [Pantoea sp. BAV 3049]
MSATLFRKDKYYLDDQSFISMVIWEVDPNIPGSFHSYKYSLAYVVDGDCIMRYDNERGKGDHKHVGLAEMNTVFTTIEALINDFFNDIETLRR